MTLTPAVITMTITNDQNPHTACEAPGGHGREVSRLPGQALDGGTAMLLADTLPEKPSNQKHATSRADPEAGL